jgi:hypothetical protein
LSEVDTRLPLRVGEIVFFLNASWITVGRMLLRQLQN